MNTLQQILWDNARCDDAVTDDTRLDALGMDSLDYAQVEHELHKMGVELPADWHKCKTVGKLAQRIETPR